MSELVKHAEKQLELAGYFDGDEYAKYIGEAVLDLMKLFSDQGHSGFSAGITIQLFSTLASWKKIVNEEE